MFFFWAAVPRRRAHGIQRPQLPYRLLHQQRRAEVHEGGAVRGSLEEELLQWRVVLMRCRVEARLNRHRQPVARRYSGGKDVDAACGMLAARRVGDQPSTT
jgi:hypothetical protein